MNSEENQQNKLFERKELIDKNIPIPKDKISTNKPKTIDIDEHKVIVFMVPLEKINCELFNLSDYFVSFSDINIIVIVLYLEKEIIQKIEENNEENITLEMLEYAIKSSIYYVMIEIDQTSIYTIKDDVQKTGLPVFFWIKYSNIIENILTGITSIVINRKIKLRTPLTIHFTMNDFKSKMLENLNELPTHLELHKDSIQESIEQLYLSLRLSLEKSSYIPMDHPFLISSTTYGKSIYEHPQFCFLGDDEIQQWIINTSIWHTT